MTPKRPVPTPRGSRSVIAMLLLLLLATGLACVAPSLPTVRFPTPMIPRATAQPVQPMSNSPQAERGSTPEAAPGAPTGQPEPFGMAAATPLDATQRVETRQAAGSSSNPARLPGDSSVPDQWQAALCPVLQGLRIFDFDIHPVEWFSQPAARSSFYDPIFDTCLARLTDHQNDQADEDRSSGMQSPGAASQAFNADSSLVLVRSSLSYWYLYSLETLQRLPDVPALSAREVAWDPLDPHLFYYTEGPRLQRYDLRLNKARLVRDFALDFTTRQVARINAWGAANTSSDGRYWVWLAENAQGSPLALLMYDLAENRVTARLDLPGDARINAVAISPRGKYVIVRHENECGGSQVQGCGLQVYNNQLENPRMLLPSGTHFDTGLDWQGRDVLVFHDLAFNSISFLDLKSGQKQALWLIDQRYPQLDLNLSGRALRRPGWALVSTFGNATLLERSWMDNTIFAIELREEGRVLRIAHTRNICPEEKLGQPWAEPGATPNLDLTRLLFNSNWGNPDGEHSEVYLVTLPEDWLEQMP